MVSEPDARDNKLQLLVSPNAENESLKINQDVWMWRGTFKAGSSITYTRKMDGNGIYVYIINGEAQAENQTLKYRDGLGVVDKNFTTISFEKDTDLLIIDVPMH